MISNRGQNSTSHYLLQGLIYSSNIKLSKGFFGDSLNKGLLTLLAAETRLSLGFLPLLFLNIISFEQDTS